MARTLPPKREALGAANAHVPSRDHADSSRTPTAPINAQPSLAAWTRRRRCGRSSTAAPGTARPAIWPGALTERSPRRQHRGRDERLNGGGRRPVGRCAVVVGARLQGQVGAWLEASASALEQLAAPRAWLRRRLPLPQEPAPPIGRRSGMPPAGALPRQARGCRLRRRCPTPAHRLNASPQAPSLHPSTVFSSGYCEPPSPRSRCGVRRLGSPPTPRATSSRGEGVTWCVASAARLPEPP